MTTTTINNKLKELNDMATTRAVHGGLDLTNKQLNMLEAWLISAFTEVQLDTLREVEEKVIGENEPSNSMWDVGRNSLRVAQRNILKSLKPEQNGEIE